MMNYSYTVPERGAPGPKHVLLPIGSPPQEALVLQVELELPERFDGTQRIGILQARSRWPRGTKLWGITFGTRGRRFTIDNMLGADTRLGLLPATWGDRVRFRLAHRPGTLSIEATSPGPNGVVAETQISIRNLPIGALLISQPREGVGYGPAYGWTFR